MSGGLAERKARSFMVANEQSPIVYAAVRCLERGGAVYRLADGKRFELTAEVHRLIKPRWLHDNAL